MDSTEAFRLWQDAMRREHRDDAIQHGKNLIQGMLDSGHEPSWTLQERTHFCNWLQHADEIPYMFVQSRNP